MKTISFICLFLSYIALARFYFVYGYNEAQSDRQRANEKLQMCLRTIYE